jgi:asparagine synthase (glutamine-hydrolysing)
MCGIAAAVAYGGDRSAPGPLGPSLKRACDAMSRRGPDGEGVWASPSGRVALGHRRLAIIDLSAAGAQPMPSADGRLQIVFNGEIYNYRALKADLERRGHSFRSGSDTEVLLALYREHGERMTDGLRGMYTFALYDADRQGVLLARDPYGIKPLYVADDRRTLRVASQVQALLAMGGVDAAPDPAGHAGFFLWGHVPEPHTLFRGVRAFPPGHTQWVDADGPRPPRRFADLTRMLGEAAGRDGGTAADAPQAVREALLDTVRAHLVADVDVGVFLSAGRDSATLAALASEAGGRPRTVTLGFDEYAGTADDEVPLAEQIAAHYRTDHRTVRVGRDEFRGLRSDFMAAMDQPSLDGLNTFLVSRAAHQAGLKVALSGLGGDELFGGYPSFTEIPRLVGLVGSVPGHAALGRGFRAVAAPLLRRLAPPKAAGLIEYGGDYGGAYLLRRGLFMPWELPAVLGDDLAREGWEALAPLARLRATVDGIGPSRLRVTALESAHYMRSQLLRDSDWASMARSLELRVPLVDWTLTETLAPVLAAHPFVGKHTMAEAARPELPDAVLNRPKTGFTTPVRDWMLDDGLADPRDRGLRGWARAVYAHHTGSEARSPRPAPRLQPA